MLIVNFVMQSQSILFSSHYCLTLTTIVIVICHLAHPEIIVVMLPSLSSILNSYNNSIKKKKTLILFPENERQVKAKGHQNVHRIPHQITTIFYFASVGEEMETMCL